MARAEPLQLRDPDAERREREERAALVRGGCEGEKGARRFLGDCARSTLYAYTREFHMRTVKLAGRRLWPRSELRRLLVEHVESEA